MTAPAPDALDELLRTGAELDARPVVAAKTGQVVAFEVLLRVRGGGSAEALVRAASEQGRVDALAGRVAELAREVLDELPPGTAVVLDLHPAELADPPGVARRLARFADRPGRLVVRLPHPGMLLDEPGCSRVLAGLRAEGYRVLLGHVPGARRLPPFALRARPDIVELPAPAGRIAPFRAAAHLVHEAGARVLATGVRTWEEGLALSAAGADLLCGPAFGDDIGRT